MSKRDELISFALEMLEDHYFKEVMKNISKLANEMRYQNWFMGDEDIILPYYNSYSGLVYEIHTWAKNGLFRQVKQGFSSIFFWPYLRIF